MLMKNLKTLLGEDVPKPLLATLVVHAIMDATLDQPPTTDGKGMKPRIFSAKTGLEHLQTRNTHLDTLREIAKNDGNYGPAIAKLWHNHQILKRHLERIAGEELAVPIQPIRAYDNLDLETIRFDVEAGEPCARNCNLELAEPDIAISRPQAFTGSLINLLARLAAKDAELTDLVMKKAASYMTTYFDFSTIEAAIRVEMCLTYGVVNLSWFLCHNVEKELKNDEKLTFEHILGTDEPGLLKMLVTYNTLVDKFPNLLYLS